MSCREFVRTFLPLRQACSPKLLDAPAESGLNNEIDTEDAQVVRGDGSNSTVDRREFRGDANYEGRLTPPEDDVRFSIKPDLEEEPSWGQPMTSLPTPPPSSDEDDRRLSAGVNAPARVAHDHHIPRRSKISRAPSLQQLRSTMSVIADASSISRRSRAHSHHDSLDMSLDIQMSHSPTNHRSSTHSVASSQTAPPRPSIRRSQYSHPDITSLCEQWASHGPANQTYTFSSDSAVNNGLSRRTSIASSHMDTQAH